MTNTSSLPESLHVLGTTALRVGVGATLFAHGAQKLFGWFGGGGREGTGQAFDQMGFQPGKHTALAAGLGEAGGGALLALGLATPAAGAAIAGTMATAATVHQPNGFFSTEGGLEYPAMLALIGASFAATGPGPVSLDHALGHSLDRPWQRVAALVAIVPAVYAVVSRRRTALAEAPAQDTASA